MYLCDVGGTYRRSRWPWRSSFTLCREIIVITSEGDLQPNPLMFAMLIISSQSSHHQRKGVWMLHGSHVENLMVERSVSLFPS